MAREVSYRCDRCMLTFDPAKAWCLQYSALVIGFHRWSRLRSGETVCSVRKLDDRFSVRSPFLDGDMDLCQGCLIELETWIRERFIPFAAAMQRALERCAEAMDGEQNDGPGVSPDPLEDAPGAIDPTTGQVV